MIPNNHGLDSNEADLITLQREASALETLAEASRQHHVDGKTVRALGDDGFNMLQRVNQFKQSQQDMDQWMAQLHDQLTQATSGTSIEGISQTSDGLPLIQTAAAATRMSRSEMTEVSPPAKRIRRHNRPELVVNHGEGVVLDPQLPDVDASINQHQSDNILNNKQDAHGSQDLDSVETALIHSYGLLANKSISAPGFKRPRNRFTPERRKQVGSVRKVGACLRCRMLKKSCSSETPCSACAAVNTPRHWNVQCIRTKLADEFGLFGTSYFFAKARDLVSKHFLVKNAKSVEGSEKVQVKLFNDSNVMMSFPILQDVEPLSTSEPRTNDQQDVLLYLDSDATNSIVSDFLQLELNHFVDKFSSPSLLVTFKTLSTSEAQQEDLLVTRVMQLWAGTCILVAPSHLHWSVTSSHTSLTEQHEKIIQAQVLDAVERFCAQTMRYVCNEVERRLISRNTTTPLTTFLVSVLLLNCVERMSLLFRRFDPEPTRPHPSPSKSPSDYDVESEWPLTHPPMAYYSQSTTFSNILDLALRMRSLPPTTMIDSSGQLKVVKISPQSQRCVTGQGGFDYISPSNTIMTCTEIDVSTSDLPGTSMTGGVNDAYLSRVATWMRDLNVDVSGLIHRGVMTDDDFMNDDNDDDNNEGYKAWDMRFVSKLILPEGYISALLMHDSNDNNSNNNVDINVMNNGSN